MAHPVFSFLSQLARKLAMAVFIAALALVAYSLWLFTGERATYEERHEHLLATTQVERARIDAELAGLNKKNKDATALFAVQQQRIVLADKTLKTLHDADPGAIDRVFGDAEQLKTHESRVARVDAIRAAAVTRSAELEREIMVNEQARAPLDREGAELERKMDSLKNEKYEAEHYLRNAWQEARWWVIGVFLVYLFGGLVVAGMLYYGWATFVSRGRAVQLKETNLVNPVIGESAVVAEESLWPGEVLWVRRKFLHATDDGLTRGNRLILNWSRPFSCVAAGLTRMVELRNSRIDGERRVVVASADDPFAELAVVSVPEGGAFVLRAGFLMGIIVNAEQPPVIRRHWRFLRWQSWVSGQFGYFEFSGPCRLIVSCVSALHAETLSTHEQGKAPTLRAAQIGLVGFSPQLELQAVRSVGFWKYCRRRSPLFDVWVAGSGALLLRDAHGRARDGFRSRVMKRAGL